VLFYVATLVGLVALRFFIVQVTARTRAAGLISAQRIFLIGTGAFRTVLSPAGYRNAH
jgi:hypothetical protein